MADGIKPTAIGFFLLSRESSVPGLIDSPGLFPRTADRVDPKLIGVGRPIRCIGKLGITIPSTRIIATELMIDWHATGLTNTPGVLGLVSGCGGNHQGGRCVVTPIVVATVPRPHRGLTLIPLMDSLGIDATLAVSVKRMRAEMITHRHSSTVKWAGVVATTRRAIGNRHSISRRERAIVITCGALTIADATGPVSVNTLSIYIRTQSKYGQHCGSAQEG